MSLLERYEVMKQANEEVEISTEEQEKVAEEMEILAKYAEAAEEGLKAEFGEDYTLEDVEKLAEMLIQRDLEIEDEEEKVAELTEAGQVMAHAFAEELQKIADQSEKKSE
jgi:pyridoxine 5'-phosphate synthase PdxJ